MFLPFKLPHAGLQAMRQRWFYSRVVFYYKIAHQFDLFNKKPLHRFGRFFLGVMFVKAIQKGQRQHKEEELADYNARRSNIAAAEKALWDEELSLHAINVSEAESAVYRQRVVDWTFRSDQAGYAKVMQALSFPFRVSSNTKLA